MSQAGPAGAAISSVAQLQLAAASALVGLTTAAILLCSHFHSIDTDRAARKMSPLVRLGTPQRGAQVGKPTMLRCQHLIGLQACGQHHCLCGTPPDHLLFHTDAFARQAVDWYHDVELVTENHISSRAFPAAVAGAAIAYMLCVRTCWRFDCGTDLAMDLRPHSSFELHAGTVPQLVLLDQCHDVG